MVAGMTLVVAGMTLVVVGMTRPGGNDVGELGNDVGRWGNDETRGNEGESNLLRPGRNPIHSTSEIVVSPAAAWAQSMPQK